MKREVQARITKLRAEFSSGQKMLAELEERQTNLRETLLRISGAIQVLEELLNEEQIKESDEQFQEQTTAKPNSAQPSDVSAE